MRKRLLIFTTLSLGLIISLGFNGCDVVSDNTTGTLTVTLTDAPFPTDQVAEANVTIVKIEAREAGGNEGSPYITLSEDTQTFDLLDLRNGVTTSLAQLDVPAGSYDLFRIYVSEGTVVMNDSATYTITVPSGDVTGIKLFVKPAVEVTGGLTSNLLLDFDVEKSFVAKGQGDTINGFNFNPVIRAVNLSTVGSLTGSVTDTSAAALANAQVWVLLDTVVSNTYTDTDGSYAILGLPAGTYTASATLAGYDTVSVPVDIAAGSQTSADFELTRQ